MISGRKLALFWLLFAGLASVAHAQSTLSNITIGAAATAAASPATGSVDLLADSDSYVPPFYKGRALPSAGTDLRLSALAYFKRANGSLVPSSQIIYTWHQDDRIIGSVSGLGQSSVVLPAATLYGTSDIEVDARSSDDAFAGSATLAIPSIEPSAILYEDDPLFGIAYYHALGAETSLAQAQMTFAVVPYFAQAESPNDPRLVYAWTVNGSTIASSGSDPSEITLNSSNATGAAAIGLSLTHATNFYMDSSGAWNITLAAQTGTAFEGTAPAASPFNGSGN